MNNLMESDLIVLTSIALGIASGILLGFLNILFDHTLKGDKISFRNSVRQCIYPGVTLGIFFGVITFVSISLNPSSLQKLNQINIIMAIVLGLFTPVFNKVFELIVSGKES